MHVARDDFFEGCLRMQPRTLTSTSPGIGSNVLNYEVQRQSLAFSIAQSSALSETTCNAAFWADRAVVKSSRHQLSTGALTVAVRGS